MAALSPERTIVLDDYLDPSTVDVIDWAPVLGLSPKDGNADTLYAALKDKHPSLAVYRKNEIPAEFRLANHPRLVSGVRVPAFENIHVYDLMCAILGIEPAKNDGDPAVTRNMLRSR